MLLAPREAIAGQIGAPRHQLSYVAAKSIVTQLRQTFGVGFQAMTWHLFHLDYLDLSEDEVARLASSQDDITVNGFEHPWPADDLARRVTVALARDAISEERARLLLRDGEVAAPA